MAGALYKNYLRVCEKWGVDPTKKGRDLGEFIRQQVAKEFNRGEASNIQNLKECEKKLESLNRIASNYYGKQFQRSKYATATGLTLEECKQVLSTEGLQKINRSKLSFLERVKILLEKKPV
ncbi:ubiquinol-cytochrome-c reductase complex assembly factor 2-like [Argiope bruennichi]|uniref:Mitochondrial nucleoid factor 1 n=1 Tax=Argiope bruennichi TaxID=94029 RepID=A0A8T0EP40_ARGBR|nr:ubiquinol-cytochrome-c reductase complex assembly factor 2-like [Argiope bruennichi]KAF8773949.1 Ubiquinol-cytochrome-c reductase complex like protein [Argiope bruennichi]